MIDREDLESLSSAQLHDRAIGSAKAGGDIDWLWHVLGSMPAAEGAIGDLEESGMDVSATVSTINHDRSCAGGPSFFGPRPVYSCNTCNALS